MKHKHIHNKVAFSDLSAWLKVAAVVAWTELAVFVIAFVIGYLFG